MKLRWERGMDMPRPDTSEVKRPKNTRGTLFRLLKYLGRYRLVIAAVVLLSILANALALLGPTLAGSAINEAAAGMGKVDLNRVGYFASRMLLVYLVSSLLTIAINVIMMYVSKWVAANLRSDIFEKLMRIPVGFFDKNSAGDIISRVSYDVDVISASLATDVVLILTSFVSVIGSLVMMAVISPRLSLIVLITLPVSIGYTVYMRKMTTPRYSKRSKAYGKLNGFTEEMFSGQKTIQAYSYADTACSRFDEINRAAADAYYDAEYYGSTLGPTMNFINNMTLGLIGMFGSIMFMHGSASLGQISSFILYSRKFAGPVNEIASIINEIFSALSAAERVFSLLDENEESHDACDVRELSDVNGKVEFSHVSFGYVEDRLVLKDLNITAEDGSLIAIVGATGAGKTTIINLLMRFYDVNSGSIKIDGENIYSFTRSSLRRSFAMVLQDTWLFKGTIYDNIAYGKENATREEVVAAAKAANIHSFIKRLPRGYDSVISDDGGNISKGQKQLLTIARAMLYRSEMLILDEATSNVDTGTERRVQEAMRSLMRGRTCFVIAHRLSTVRNADKILVIDHGDVVEQGTHEELMAKKGHYFRLYSAQFE